jgi:hypothetical protein
MRTGAFKKMAPRCPNPYIEPSVAVVTYDLALVAISLHAPVRIAPSHRARAYPHLLEMPPYALLLHSVPAHTPNGIPRTESRGTSARSTCTAGSRARLPGVCFRVVRDQELRAARELAEAHVPRPVLHHPCLRCVHCLRRCRRRLRPEPNPPHRALRPSPECRDARIEAHVLVASAARRVRVRKHPAIEQTNAALRLRLSRVCLVAHPVRSHRAQRSLHTVCSRIPSPVPLASNI